ncbi:DUF3179 domain-containing protein [Candidatus Uhrbacteria bacterium]|nr:DUF3179 domain-containing protein [Candidatus Uhrbacteria bacterium]MBI4598941.1 DUF3179 domain-containing protein [Candidatus Uhrbacteria bacterium]
MSRPNARFVIALLIPILAVAFFFFRTSRAYRVPDMSSPGAGPWSEARDVNGTRHLVPPERILPAGVMPESVPALEHPSFESVPAADQHLDDAGTGIVVEAGNRQRFYPFQILVWHQVVNDVVDGRSIVVFHDPLSGASGASERGRAEGDSSVFLVSGNVYEGHSLLQDRQTGSLWSPVLGVSVRGTLAGTSLVPSPQTVLMTWGAFKQKYPGAEVLSRNTGFERDYTRNPYEAYASSNQVWFPLSSLDGRLPAKARVYGFVLENGAKAYPVEAVTTQPVLSDTVGGEGVLFLHDAESGVTHVFSRHVGDQTLTFQTSEDDVQDVETGSTWDLEGRAVGGPLAGTRLEPISAMPLYWFAWAAIYPETELFSKVTPP